MKIEQVADLQERFNDSKSLHNNIYKLLVKISVK